MSGYDISVITTGNGLTLTEKQNLIDAALDQIDQKVRQYHAYLTQSPHTVPSEIYVKAIVLGEGIIKPLVALHITDEKLDTSAMGDEEIVALYETAKAAEEIYIGFDASETTATLMSSKITK